MRKMCKLSGNITHHYVVFVVAVRVVAEIQQDKTSLIIEKCSVSAVLKTDIYISVYNMFKRLRPQLRQCY